MSEPEQAPDGPAHESLVYRGRGPLRLVELAPSPWAKWSRPGAREDARARRFIERAIVVPTGAGSAMPMRLATFQREMLTTIYDSLASFFSLPAGNGKTSFLAAVSLERLCRGDHYTEVAVVSTRQETAGLLVAAARRMVESSPELARRCRWHSREQALEFRPTGSVLRAHPAKLSAIQGLAYSLAILDEFGFVGEEIADSMIARLGKQPDARIVGIGTPGYTPNVMHRLREKHLAGELPPGVVFREWRPTDPACAVTDRRAWRQANPAIGAGFLNPGALEVQARLLPERDFRTLNLGLWVDQSAPWLPPGSWNDCPSEPPPPPGAEVVLAVEGTFRRSAAIMGCTTDGSLFHLWSADVASDSDLRRAIETAAGKWTVRAISYPQRIRPRLFADLQDVGLPVEPWDRSFDNEATASNEFFRAVVGSEGLRLAHDHSKHVAEQMLKVRARYGMDGSIRLARPEDGGNVDSAIGARSAWWRARQLADEPVGELVIY